MFCRFTTLFLAIFCYINPIIAETQIIQIRNQKEFDGLSNKIREAISKDEIDCLFVNITKGVYLFHDAHLNLNALSYLNKKIHINGNGAILIPDSVSRVGTQQKPYEVCYLDDKLNAVSSWSEVIQLSSAVEIMSANQKRCRIKIPSGVTVSSDCEYIKLSEWFKVGLYHVTQIKDGFIYFEADDLSTSNYGYNVNWDYGYGKTYPRMQLLQPKPHDAKYICKAGSFLCMVDTKLKHLEFNDLSFIGGSGSKILIMLLNDNTGKIIINRCKFQYCLGIIAYLEKTSNFNFTNNVIENCDNVCVCSQNGSVNTYILNNMFVNVCATINNKAAVSCRSDNFWVKGNLFQNFSYTAVSCGLHHSLQPKYKVTGSIEDNEFCYDNKYASSIASKGLMDGGAIYITTQTDGIRIRNNYIHDIMGVKDNRGIFCDDGAKNVTITGNVIQRIQNSYCIDLRNVTFVAEKVPDHNTGNTCTDNLVDGDIRFYLRDESCQESNNKKIGDRGYKTMMAYKKWKRKIH